MTLYESPMLRRRSRLQVAAWMTALCVATGQMNGAEMWLAYLMTALVESEGATP